MGFGDRRGLFEERLGKKVKGTQEIRVRRARVGFGLKREGRDEAAICVTPLQNNWS